VGATIADCGFSNADLLVPLIWLVALGKCHQLAIPQSAIRNEQSLGTDLITPAADFLHTLKG
jgi:hypothetical protein